ncbi:acetate--CoA ligase family protein [Lentzea tibetensis]|uniref:Acetate--CoA ligase family protein n=1 Tax=Lentzea tibetensis TaxID=2591470 RepID=A0A563F338_9PSEU|nr:acetate--CoA ligase family protein [Lentzea tibetensis]TWP54171.1 acetate--CoA ligase family protein [Lentzea tibetensis]
MSRDLTALFAPRSVAVVGASDDHSKYGNWISVRALRGSREVHLVNRTRPTVLGRPTVPSLRDVDGPVDLAVITVPAQGFAAAVDDALAIGVRAVVGITGGLGDQQDEIARKVREAGACLLGPNCLGVLDCSTNLELTSYDFPAGQVAMISQSGNIAIELAGPLADAGLGYSRFASLGNQADLDAADLVDACAEHDETRAIALYCEDFRDGRRFARAAARAHAAGKPVVLLAVGRGQASARGARSHTGSLVTDGVVVEAACDAAGIELVSTPTEMAHLLQALLRTRPPRGRRVAVFADGGGQAQVASDCLEAAGMDVPRFTPELAADVAADLPPAAATENPVDVAGGGEQDIGCFSRITATLTETGEVDAVLLTGFFGGYGEYGPSLAAGELAAAHDIAALKGNVVVHTMNWRSLAADVLREGGVAVYRSVEDAVWALDRLTRRGAHVPPGVPPIPPAEPPLRGNDYWTARRFLSSAGLPFPPGAEVRTLAELRAARLRYPVVLKALGDDHKSDRGGVVLGIDTPEALEDAWHDVATRLTPEACSVEEMADTSVELILGVRQDLRFGPVVLAGFGGVYAEVLRDNRCALGPVSKERARRLLLSLRGAPLLTGFRGRPAVDVDAAADVLVALSEVAAAHPELAEIECNPVAVTPHGALCLDARIVLVP